MHFLCSFRPLAASPHGREAIHNHQLPPFIDASCRREPDLQARYPSISALCRKQYFAPRLRPGDHVAYITVKRIYPGQQTPHRRLVALLRIKTTFQNHRDAAAWYRAQNAPLPSNCIVFGNLPEPLDRTDRFQDHIRRWDAEYHLRARQWGTFHACDALFLDLYTPPVLSDATLKQLFGTIPGTQTPPAITKQQFSAFAALTSTHRTSPPFAPNTGVAITRLPD